MLTGALLLLGCATAAPTPRMTLHEAGLTPLPVKSASSRRLTALDAATEVLLTTIERETGDRPAFEDDDENAPDPEDVAAALHSRPQGWLPERTSVAVELLRATDLGQATVKSISRARLAILWAQQIDARRSDVDEQIVARAMKRAAELVGPVDPLPAGAESEVRIAHSGVLHFVWPVSPVQITSRFGVRIDPFGDGARRHLGLDLVALEGQSVTSAADGIVRFAGKRGGYGLHVEIHHDDGYVTRYAHLSKVFVAEGSRVMRGDSIGRAGHTGRATGPHLHFELWRKGVPLNPVQLLSEESPIAWAD